MSGLELTHVTPQVLCVRRPRYLSASYIVHDEAGIVLVDAGMQADGSDMLRGLRSAGLRASDVRAILLTHWHNGHSSGAEARRLERCACTTTRWRRRTSSARPSVPGAPGPGRVPEHGPFAALKAVVGQSPPRALAAAELVHGGETLEQRFEVLHTPGHTAGHLSFHYRPGRVLFAGDALAVCRGRLWFLSRFLTEDRAQARESMLRVLELDVQAVCPGHRGPLTERVAEHRASLRAELEAGRRWPWIA